MERRMAGRKKGKMTKQERLKYQRKAGMNVNCLEARQQIM